MVDEQQSQNKNCVDMDIYDAFKPKEALRLLELSLLAPFSPTLYPARNREYSFYVFLHLSATGPFIQI
jgi:hypothetical protein